MLTARRNSHRMRPLHALLLLVAGCSLQKFDYLQHGGGGSAGASSMAGSGSGDAGGTSNLGNEAGDGPSVAAGNSHSSGGKAGSNASGGTDSSGGEDSGEGGAAGAPGGGGPATGDLVNGSFETTNTSGWKVDPADALTLKHAFVQWPVGSGSVPDGKYQLSTWHQTDAFSVEVSQTVEGLKDGSYTFKGYFSRGDGFNQVYLFARGCSETDPEPVPVPLTEPTQWLAVELAGIVVSGGSCTVGLFVDSNANNWLNADKFSLLPDEPVEAK